MQHVMMRRAVGAAENAAGAVARAVACGIGKRRFLCLDHEREQTTGAAAERAVAAGIRAELVAREEQREAHLGDLQAAELDAAGGMPFADARPAVAGGRAAASRARLEHVPDEWPVAARVLPLDG